ncbi:MAG: Tol-Pal system beta propeller repeat protein TolB [Deltaproteobacteria bacterium]|nr:Tol-Pal system beta propeller repeat protein TolB [Deltaproteobacteria bacterium]
MKRGSQLSMIIIVMLLGRLAAAQIHIVIDQPAEKRFPIAIANLAKTEGFHEMDNLTKKIPDMIRRDLELSGYFFVIGPSAYLDRSDAVTANTIDFQKWTAIGAMAVVKGIARMEGGRITVDLKLFDPHSRQLQMEKQYTYEQKNLRFIGHRFADEVLLSTTGLRGPFASRIAYTSETSRRKHWKQIYVMEVDGENNTRLTKDKSYNLGPAWAPDGKQLVFVSYVDGFPDIYSADMRTGHRRRLTSNRSTNITPAWSREGSLIAFASGMERDMDLYLMNTAGSDLRPLTQAFGIDIAPRFSPEGNDIVFASERGGKLHIYRQPVGGGTVQRLTFVGYQNDSPDWSSDGQKITFCGRSSGTYDIFVMNSDGTNIQRLTSGAGSNEHPRWAPDGRYITFSSTRGGSPQIYMMRYDGAHQTKLSKGNGSLPDWSPWVTE